MSRAPAAVLLISVALAATGCTSQASSPSGSRPGAACAAQGGNNGHAVSGRAVPLKQWNRPPDQAARVRAAGLDLLPAEDLSVHYHAHLDVLIDGNHVPVPPELGISVPTAASAAGTHHQGSP